jgi:hypothetical protein
MALVVLAILTTNFLCFINRSCASSLVLSKANTSKKYSSGCWLVTGDDSRERAHITHFRFSRRLLFLCCNFLVVLLLIITNFLCFINRSCASSLVLSKANTSKKYSIPSGCWLVAGDYSRARVHTTHFRFSRRLLFLCCNFLLVLFLIIIVFGMMMMIVSIVIHIEPWQYDRQTIERIETVVHSAIVAFPLDRPLMMQIWLLFSSSSPK